MIVRLHNIHAFLSASPEERDWVEQFLSFETRGMRGVVKHVTLLGRFDDDFPAGLAPLVADQAKREGMECEILDAREKPCQPDRTTDLSWLRDYQRAAVEAVWSRGRGIISHPTAAGKSVVIAALCKSIPCRWVVLVPSTSLLRQTSDMIEARIGESVGRVGDGECSIHRATVATWQSVASDLHSGRPLGCWKAAEGLIVDEAHVLGGSSPQRVCRAMPRAWWRIGASATPLDRADDRNLLVIGATGPIIHKVSARELTGSGVIAKPRVKIVPVRVAPCASDDWSEAYRLAVTENDVRTARGVALCERAQKPCLAFVKEIEHGRRLIDALRAHRLKTAFVWGDLHAEERSALARKLLDGELDVLVVSAVFSQGVDLPALRSLVNLSAGKTPIATLQRTGRGMRRAPGKEDFELWDLADIPCAPRCRHNACRWLSQHAKARRAAWVREGFEVRVWELPSETLGGA